MPDSTARAQFERTLTRELSTLLNQTRTRFVNALYHQGFTQGELANVPEIEMLQFEQDLTRALQPKMIELFIKTSQEYAGMMQWFVDDGQLEILANQWANANIPLLVQDLINTTKTNLRLIADRAPELPLDKNALGLILGGIGVFGVARAILIAQDQATRARSASEDNLNREMNNQDFIEKIEEIWYTKRDERVCPQCRPLHGKARGDGWDTPPPLHPRCRCERKFKITNSDGQVFTVNSREEIDDGKSPVSVT